MNRRLILSGVFAALLLSVSACGSTGSDTKNDSGHNTADVTFAQQMIPHHEQAVQMANLAPMQAQSAEVEQLAADIEAAQGPEIKTMTGWLKSWGEDVSMAGMDGGNSSMDMPGLMSTADMNQLMAAKGADFDMMFLTMMISHHEGAIQMAKDEQSNGKNPDAIALAKSIESAQTTEITKMQGMLQK